MPFTKLFVKVFTNKKNKNKNHNANSILLILSHYKKIGNCSRFKHIELINCNTCLLVLLLNFGGNFCLADED